MPGLSHESASPTCLQIRERSRPNASSNRTPHPTQSLPRRRPVCGLRRLRRRRRSATNNSAVNQKQPQRTEVPDLTLVGGGVARLEDLGMRPKIMSEIRRLVTQPRGMLLC